MSSPTACTISATGITAPSYQDILNYLVTQYEAIFGADSYLGNDSQDGQLLAVFAQGLSDANAATIAAYNSFSPATAQGTGLSSNVKINGLERNEPSYSTAQLTVGGIANTTITNGVAIDANNYLWALPATVVIPAGGSVVVQATCTTVGAITAAANTINQIQNAVYGWQSVNNSAAAALGAPVETDAALRVRQSQSVALPSVTIFEGIVAAIDQVTGVTRAVGYENNTTVTNGNGVPAHSLAFVVEGGQQSAIANAIASKITPGVGTYGTTSTTVVDSVGSVRTINYSLPTDARITVAITLTHLNGWSTTTEALIQNAIVAFLEALPIGANISYTGLFVPAYLLGTNYNGTYNITAMTLQKNAGAAASADIQLAWNEAAVCAPTNVTFVVN